jgi:hypothetical protein
MWEWLLGRQQRTSKRRHAASEPATSETLPRFTVASTVGAVAEEMKAKRYQGPFANLCDGMMIATLHGPNVGLEPRWIEAADNPFQMRILDCAEFCTDSPIFALGDDAKLITAQLKQDRNHMENCVQRHDIPEARKLTCRLSFPSSDERIPEGAQFVAECMEDLWNIFRFDDQLYFTRSWTGQLRYRAKLLFRPEELCVIEVEACSTRPANDIYRNLDDDKFPVKQVDFLIKALLYRAQAPAPLPRGLSKSNPGSLALFSLIEYGRWGWFPTFDDTTEYRSCLN